MINLQTLLPSSIANLFNTMYAWYLRVFMDKTQTITGATPQTLNATSGIVNFTDVISGTSGILFTLSNNNITSTSIINWGIIYTGTGIPNACFYYPSSNSVRFVVYNLSASATNANISIWYQIIA